MLLTSLSCRLISGVVHISDQVDVETPMSKDQWNKATLLRNFCIVRKLEGQSWPPGFEQVESSLLATPLSSSPS